MTEDKALEAAYLAGFNASGEGYNGEYPFGDHVQDPEEDAVWCKDRDDELTAIKQARALDKKAENARELGLDYEPADGTQVSKVWWDGEKLMAKPIPLEDIYQPAPVQEPEIVQRVKRYAGQTMRTARNPNITARECIELANWIAGGQPAAQPAVQERTNYAVHLHHCNIGECEGVCKYLDDDCPALKHADMKAKWDRPTPPAQPAPVQEPVAIYQYQMADGSWIDQIKDSYDYNVRHGQATVRIVYTTPPAQPAPEQYTALEQALTRLQKRYAELEAKVAAQPAPVKWSDYEPDGRRYPTVPDAFGTREGEHPQYIQGWNDCRAEMLKGMK
jgi:hypothetical protein